MRLRVVISVAILAIMGMIAASCGEGNGENQAASRTDHLPAAVRAKIRDEMTLRINPAFMRMWLLSQQGQTTGINDQATRLRTAVTTIVSEVRMAQSMPRDVQRDILDLYQRLDTQAGELAEKGTAGDSDGVQEILRTTRRDICNGCHRRYEYRPI